MRYFKILILSLLSLAVCIPAYTQDFILLKNSEVISAKVININPSGIVYKDFDNLDGPSRFIRISEVQAITYENGNYEEFAPPQIPKSDEVIQPEVDEPKPVPPAAQEQVTPPPTQEQTPPPPNNEIQSKPSPPSNNSKMGPYIGSVSLGYGTNHAGLGVKALIGWSKKQWGNQGAFVSVGTYREEFFWTVGGQIGDRTGWNVILSVGNVGVNERTITQLDSYGQPYTTTTKDKVTGMSLTVGKRISLDKKKRAFIDLDIGYSVGPDEFKELALDVGFGVRF